MHQLTRAGQGDRVKRLLDEGEDVNKRDEYGWTLLMAAACEGQTEVVRLLAEKGADVNLVNEKQGGMTALMMAVRWGHVDTVKALAELGANLDYRNNHGVSAFSMSIGNEAMLQVLIESGVDINLRDHQGRSAFFNAVESRNTGLALRLMELGADINVQDHYYGRTPLMLSLDRPYGELMGVLIGAGADLNLQNREGYTALMSVLSYDGTGNKPDILIEAGADIHIKSLTGETALMRAASIGRVDLVKALIAMGADLNAKGGKYVTTALMEAVSGYFYSVGVKAREEIVAILCDVGADVNVQDVEGKTALILAMERNNQTIVNILKAKTDLDIAEEGGKTPLMYAIENGKEELARSLIDLGANIDIEDKKRNTALIYAFKREMYHIANILFRLNRNPPVHISKRILILNEEKERQYKAELLAKELETQQQNYQNHMFMDYDSDDGIPVAYNADGEPYNPITGDPF